MKPIVFALAVAVLVPGTGCGGDGAAAAGSVVPASIADAPASAITPGYLAGTWCHAYVMAGNERVEEGIDYVFKRDGTLLYQNNPGSAVDRTGVWTHEGDTLSVGPAIWTITKEIGTVEPDRFVLGKGGMKVVFERGACAPEAAS